MCAIEETASELPTKARREGHADFGMVPGENQGAQGFRLSGVKASRDKGWGIARSCP